MNQSLHRVVCWKDWNDNGFEHLTLKQDSSGYLVQSVITGEHGGNEFDLQYSLRLDSGWCTREVTAEITGGQSIHLFSDAKGKWTSPDGQEIESLAGCIDVDIAATPFTNTLPIRRLILQINQTKKVKVTYVQLPTLKLQAVDQRYTRLGAQKFLYEGMQSGFSAELDVDRDGIVLDYPEVFKRQKT